MPHAPNIAAKLRELPASPGVYQMKDARGRIIYIGKALSLKNRVPSYFQAAAAHDPRIAHMVQLIVDFDWIIVPSELDALMLESSLIRQFKPPYNTMLKDDKSYPYVKITKEAYPRVMLTRRYLADGAKYWGPLTSVSQVRSAVRFIAGLFQLRTCKLELDGEQFFPKPCLDYHLKICSGPCSNEIKQKDYAKLVAFAQDFFNGKYSHVVTELKTRMLESSERKEYEAAARYRDLIDGAEKSVARQRIIGKPGENMDVLGVARSKDKACVLLMPVRDGRMVGDRKFVLNHRLEDHADHDVLAGFIKLHYANPFNVPPELVLPYEPNEMELLSEWLGRLRGQMETGGDVVGATPASPANGVAAASPPPDSGGTGGPPVEMGTAGGTPTKKSGSGRSPSRPEDGLAQGPAPTQDDEPMTDTAVRPTSIRHVVFTVPQRGHKRDLIDIAVRNAQERLHTVLLESDGDYVVTPGQRALAKHLGLGEIPKRVEGYDIANIQGKQATGSMVVSEGGRAAPSEYRLFNIRLKSTPDDFAMIRETLKRRLIRLMTDPRWKREVDVVMIDGGKGQLSSARQVMDELQDSAEFSSEQKAKLEAIKLCSLAKREELVYHYLDNDEVEELSLLRTDPGLRLLVKLRDEAHRYGNAQHQRMRDKAMRASVLDTIPGLGDAKKAALLSHFGSVKKMREADETQLAEVKGIGEHFAAHIKKYLERDVELEDLKAVKKREMKIVRRNRRGRG